MAYTSPTRTLDIRASVQLTSGESISLTKDQLMNYELNQDMGYEGLPLGSVSSASYRLTTENIGRKYTHKELDRAKVEVEIGIVENGVTTWSPFGVWYVDDADAPEQSVAITFFGADALASRFSATFTDNGHYPTTLGSLAQTICTAAGVRLKSTAFPNAAVQVSKKPEWDESVTLRDIISYIAICAGGFARIDRSGELEILSFIDGKRGYTLDPDVYKTFTPQNGRRFKLNCIEAMLNKDDEEYSRFAIDSTIESNATNTIQIDYNPLLTQDIVNSIVSELSQIEMVGGSLTWGGDPSVMCSDWYEITTLTGEKVNFMVTDQAFEFAGGLFVSEFCNAPTENSEGRTYSSSTNLYNQNGKINAERIDGLDKSVINATVGHFEHLTANTAEFDALVAAYIKVINLVSENMTTNTLTATMANIINATIKKLQAGEIKTDELYAAMAEIIALKVETLDATSIETDKLAAALANFTVITAGSASFDQATIQHLVAEAMNLEFGSMNQVFIKNLAVEYAQMVGATIGNLVIKASDGKYYEINVDVNGHVTATEKAVTDTEIGTGATEDGKILVESNITAGELNAGNILATYALINKIQAARIDVDELFVREAFLKKLVTSQIFADGGSLEIISNISNSVQKWFRFDFDRGLVIRKPAYTDTNGVEHPASNWYTVTDEIGYHVYNVEQSDPAGSFQRGGLITTGVQIGDIVAKRDTYGGWVWTDP